MVTISREVIIDEEVIIHASLAKIYNYISKPSNLPQVCSSLIEIKNEQLLPNGGYKAEWVYKMAGTHLAGTGEYVEVVPMRYFTIKTEGAIDSTITMTFRPKNEQTRVTLTIDYRIPFPLLAWLSGRVIVKLNEKETEHILANLKTIMEES